MTKAEKYRREPGTRMVEWVGMRRGPGGDKHRYEWLGMRVGKRSIRVGGRRG